jgi:hypothetical protein
MVIFERFGLVRRSFALLPLSSGLRCRFFQPPPRRRVAAIEPHVGE